MKTASQFLSPEKYFEHLLTKMAPQEKALYDKMKHVRIEPANRDRKFIVYEMKGREPSKIDTINVVDFLCDDENGASAQVERLSNPGEFITVGHTPVQLFDLPIFLFIPLNSRMKFTATEDKPDTPSLSFLMVVRTLSRVHLRERGVVYMENNRSFQSEFFNRQS